MKYLNVCLLAAVACTYSLQAAANLLEHNSKLLIGNEFSLPSVSAVSPNITPLELKSIASSNYGVKFASVCHITDGNCLGSDAGFNSGDNDINLDNKFQCNEEGYNLTSCSDKQTPEDICPFDSKYFKSCKCSAEYKYSQANCNSSYPNSIIGSEQCIANGVAYSNSCVCNTASYPYTSTSCNGKEELTGATCKDTSNITYANACTCIGGDAKYKHTDASCKTTHSGFTNWTINDDVCNDKATDCVCTPNSGACSGYTLDSDTCSGGSKIGESCNNGCQLKWKCKDLCPYKGTLTSCPNNYVCTLEECSNKLYLSGCAVNYINFCTPPVTDCVTLGYNLTTADCDVNNSLKCPYDGTKLSCATTCKIGSILYSDKTCSKALRTDKTPIAIVFDADKKLAVALEDAPKQYGWWIRFEDVNALSNCVNESQARTTCNPDGKSNTSKIISQLGATTNYAAGYCYNYTTIGTSKGDWFLASLPEMIKLYNVKTTVHNTLRLLGKKIFSSDDYYWTSTEYGYEHAWMFDLNRDGLGNTYYASKGSQYDNYVRPVLAY